MADIVQNLNNRVPIVDANGRPTLYFLRQLQDLGAITDGKVDITTVNQLIADALAGHSVNAGIGLSGGGALDTNPTLNAVASAILDELGLTQGDILFRDVAGWNVLAPGTAGQVLTSGGPAANPAWAAGGGGGGSGAFVLISEVVTSGSQASVTFSSIPQTFRHLKLLINGRSSYNDNDVGIQMTFSGDSGTNYDWAQTFNGSGVNNANQTSYRGQQIVAANAPANYFDGGETTISNYASTTQYKTMYGSCADYGSGSPNVRVLNYSGRWRNISAVTSITLTLSGGNWVDGSIIGLYGIGQTAGSVTPVWKSQTATGTGASQNITLSAPVSAGGLLLVFVNGLEYPPSDYVISGTTLTLATNASGDAIEVIWQ